MQRATWSKRTSTRAISKSGERYVRETKSRHAVKPDGFSLKAGTINEIVGE